MEELKWGVFVVGGYKSGTYIGKLQSVLEMFLVEFKLGGTFLIELIAEAAEFFG